jgi:hypothetical protein
VRCERCGLVADRERQERKRGDSQRHSVRRFVRRVLKWTFVTVLMLVAAIVALVIFVPEPAEEAGPERGPRSISAKKWAAIKGDMPAEAVRRILGAPERETVRTVEGLVLACWVYGEGYTVCFDEGWVVAKSKGSP